MKVTTPITLLLDTSKVTTNITLEPDTNGTPDYDPPIWDTNVNYVEGDTVTVVSQHKVYQCIADANSTFSSPEIDIVSSTPHWYELRYTNKWNMFNYNQDTASYKSSPLTVTLTPQVRSSNLAILNLTGATEITVSATNGGNSVDLTYCNPIVSGTGISVTKSTTLNITGSDITRLVVYDLPAITTIVYVVTITGPGVISCKHCILGWPEYIGALQDDVKRTNINFSTIDRDTYGTVTLIKRRSIPKLNYSLYTAAADVNKVIAVRDQLNATVALWNAMDDNVIPDYTNSLMILGFYRDFSIRLDNPVAATVSLEIEEM